MNELGGRVAYYMLLIYCSVMSLATFFGKRVADIVFIIMFVNVLIMYVKQKKFEIDLFHKLLIIFFGYSLLSILWSANKSYALGTNISIFQRVVFAICIYGIVDNRERVGNIIKCILIGGLLTLVYLYVVYGYNGILNILLSESTNRFGSEITNPNTLGATFSASCLASWYLLLNKKYKFLSFALFGLFFVFVIASGSRSSFLGLVAGMIACSCFSSSGNRIPKILLAVLFLYVGFQIIRYFGIIPGVVARFDNLFDSLRGNAQLIGGADSRLEFVRYGLSKILQNPLFGYGAGQFRYYMGTDLGLAYSSHNNYIEVLFSYGLIGAFIWYGMYLYGIINLWKNTKNPENVVLIAMLIMRMTSDFSGHSFSTSFPYLIIALAFAAIRINAGMIVEKVEFVSVKSRYKYIRN